MRKHAVILKILWQHWKKVNVLVIQWCLTHCNPMDCSPPGSSVHLILQAGILEWVVMLSLRGSSDSGIEPTSLMSPVFAGGFFTTSATWEAHIALFNLQSFSIMKNKIID